MFFKIQKSLVKLICCSLIATSFVGCDQKKSEVVTSVKTDRQSIQSWQNMKFGMFIHWGIYSVPAGVWKGKKIEKLGEQIQRHAHIPNDEYADIAKQFNPVQFDSDAMVKMAKDAGMKYVVLTAKHHDGFCMFDSKLTDFDIMDASPYKKDILKQLANSCKKYGIKLGVYYSTPDWHFNGPNPEVNPIDGKISVFSKVSKENADYQVAQLKEILSNYGDICELFFDMGEPTRAQSERFANTVHSLQPNCMINGRVMNNQGDFITMPDNHVPDVPVDTMAWETPGTFYHTWGYKSWVKGDPVPAQVKQQVRKLVQVAARGGNFLLNIGPKPDGTVLPYEQKVLAGIGLWMKNHNQGIWGVNNNPFKKLPWGECTVKGNELFFYVYDWPENNQLRIPGLVSNVVSVKSMEDMSKSLSFRKDGHDVIVDLSNIEPNAYLSGLKVSLSDALDIVDPMIMPQRDHSIVIHGEDAICYGKYGKESYRSILKDFSRSWDVNVTQVGSYRVELTYRMKFDQKKFKFIIGNDPYLFTLFGSGKWHAKLDMIDGNETAHNKTKKKKSLKGYKTKSIGVVSFKKIGRNTLQISQGEDFPFVTTIKEFKKQNPKYKTMNIDIKTIKLIPVES
ncbi:alpha-L-fucosidase [Halosquirtibacter laminarini]|uniref:Alpha-L-fucosidase n=1 Tax=Halosquirtibacter laminarini TaxID=3374600 RepID=A0AC61NJ91_9BACT|nr:alpha-L-fucosidase [Prolixibacteraceae bacterium]